MNPEIVALQKRVEAARLAKARAEAAREQAEKLRAEALQALQDEFGIDNLADARGKLEQLRSKAQEELNEVVNILNEIE
jgi:ribosome recycling factor